MLRDMMYIATIVGEIVEMKEDTYNADMPSIYCRSRVRENRSSALSRKQDSSCQRSYSHSTNHLHIGKPGTDSGSLRKAAKLWRWLLAAEGGAGFAEVLPGARRGRSPSILENDIQCFETSLARPQCLSRLLAICYSWLLPSPICYIPIGRLG